MSDDDVVVIGNEAGVTYLLQHRFIAKTWIELLPDERAHLRSLEWIPINPKNSLIQLAEILDDWDREDG